ncbi:transglutaminase family protein [Neolewinella antarctica]|uniref:Transglutaminase-like putative cysteine protease n=1 Tax=Neolewinella antarctica TaxID=442734 RepID=A0ABX0XFG7_9BACT|nr:transglutaminase family protein [Neolewinella antarctica]NJC27649.1 transglutaminase-like putative cysteine protease [Neolewinella antarctica]
MIATTPPDYHNIRPQDNQAPKPLRVALRHHTSYRYDQPVQLSPQVIRLRPAPHARNLIERYSLRIDPPGHYLNWQQDPLGNFQARAVFTEPTDHLTIDVELVTEMSVINPFDFFLEHEALNFPFDYTPALRKQLGLYLELSERGPLLKDFVARPQVQGLIGKSTVDALVELAGFIAGYVDYDVRMEPGVQTCETTLSRRNGSCRDSAWLLIQVLRHFGLGARFVSGYLIQLVPEQPEPNSIKEDFADLHAWCEVYLPGAGWVGIDATSGLFTGEGHIPLAATADPANAAPIVGTADLGKVTFNYTTEVERV